MSKLTKEEVKKHEQALKLLEKEKLTYKDCLFVFENWNESAESMNSKYGAFFTPFGLASDFGLEIYRGKDYKIIDLCAGIGILSFIAYHHCEESDRPQITCLELNSKYIEVGKKLLPQANWIQGSVLDKALIESLGRFNQSISNPPFGKIQHEELEKDFLRYKGAEFEFKVMEVASKISDIGTFIVPQGSTPYRYSGAQWFIDYQKPIKGDFGSMPVKVHKFINETNIKFNFNLGIDTSVFKDEWKGVSPICEIVNIDYSGKYY